ncbi:MAG: hypothetical protein RR994_06280, partial [Clostridia bacterium]
MNVTANTGAGETQRVHAGGMFGIVESGAAVSDCKADSVKVTGLSTETANVAGFVAVVRGGIITRCSTTNATVTYTGSAQCIAGGFVAQTHDWGGFSPAFNNCFADGNIVITRNGATELRVGGFVGFTQQSGAYYNNQTVCKITANGAEGYTGFFGGFAGDNSNVGYTGNRYLGNTYTGSTYPKVGASSGTPSAQITDQMIRLEAPIITISKLMLDPPEGAWVSGSAGVGLQANITKTAAVAGALEVFVSANSAATTGT